MPKGRSATLSKSKMVNALQKPIDRIQTKAISKLDRKVSRLVSAAKTDSHYLDTSQALTPGSTASIGILTAMNQGDTEQSRDGEAVSLRHMRFSATLIPNATAAFDACRLIVFRWKNTGAPTVTQVLQASLIDSPYNRDYRESVSVLMDKKLDVSITNGTKQIKLSKSLGNAVATFTGTTSADYNTGHVWFLFLFSDNTNKAQITYYNRITFSP